MKISELRLTIEEIDMIKISGSWYDSDNYSDVKILLDRLQKSKKRWEEKVLKLERILVVIKNQIKKQKEETNV